MPSEFQRHCPAIPSWRSNRYNSMASFFNAYLRITASVGGLKSHMSTGEKHTSYACKLAVYYLNPSPFVPPPKPPQFPPKPPCPVPQYSPR